MEQVFDRYLGMRQDLVKHHLYLFLYLALNYVALYPSKSVDVTVLVQKCYFGQFKCFFYAEQLQGFETERC